MTRVLAVLALFPLLGGASILVSDSGLVNPDQTISFSFLSGMPNQAITNEYAGQGLALISPSIYYDSNPGGCSFLNLDADCLGTFMSYPDGSVDGFVSQFSLLFGSPVSRAALTIVTNDGSAISISTFLANQMVETQAFTGFQDSTFNIYQASAPAFDRIDINLGPDDFALIGNLQFNSTPTPEPSTLLSIGLVLGLTGIFGRKRISSALREQLVRRSR